MAVGIFHLPGALHRFERTQRKKDSGIKQKEVVIRMKKPSAALEQGEHSEDDTGFSELYPVFY